MPMTTPSRTGGAMAENRTQFCERPRFQANVFLLPRAVNERKVRAGSRYRSVPEERAGDDLPGYPTESLTHSDLVFRLETGRMNPAAAGQHLMVFRQACHGPIATLARG
jgi:hypothetical protein